MKAAGAQNVLFTEYAQTCITIEARQLSQRSEFRRSDEEDLQQDLWLTLLKEADRFDPKRASLNTFIDRVVNTAAGMIVRRPYRRKRAPGSRVLSLDATSVSVSGDVKKPLAQYVSVLDLSQRIGAVPRDEAAHREDAEAIDHALNAMPEHVRDVCRRVMGGSIASASSELGTSRHCIREMLQAARPYLEQAGFNGQ